MRGCGGRDQAALAVVPGWLASSQSASASSESKVRSGATCVRPGLQAVGMVVAVQPAAAQTGPCGTGHVEIDVVARAAPPGAAPASSQAARKMLGSGLGAPCSRAELAGEQPVDADPAEVGIAVLKRDQRHACGQPAQPRRLSG
jgi:hypothetical protein